MGEDRKAAIVTGAAGGVGREVVRRLLDRGYGVVAEDVSPTVAELAEDDSVAALEADVALSGSARRAVELATSRFGRLDLLVNNAARFLRRSAAETTDEDFDRLVATNLRGAFLHAREALEPLAATRGTIVNVASISGLIGMPNQVAYAMTKGGLVQLTPAGDRAGRARDPRQRRRPGDDRHRLHRRGARRRPRSRGHPRPNDRPPPAGAPAHRRRGGGRDRLPRLRCGERDSRGDPRRRRRLHGALTCVT